MEIRKHIKEENHGQCLQELGRGLINHGCVLGILTRC